MLTSHARAKRSLEEENSEEADEKRVKRESSATMPIRTNKNYDALESRKKMDSQRYCFFGLESTILLSKFFDPLNRIAFERVFSCEKNKDSFVHLINNIMNFKDGGSITSATFLEPATNFESCSYVKESVIDVLCQTQQGTKIIVQMLVSYMKPILGFMKRAEYYAANAFSRTDDRYANVEKIIFITTCNYLIFPEKEEYISHGVTLKEESYNDDLKNLSFSFVELPKFPISDSEDLKTNVNRWCYYFKHASDISRDATETQLEGIMGDNPMIRKAYEGLKLDNWSTQGLMHYSSIVTDTRDEESRQSYLIKKMEESRAEIQAEVLAKFPDEEKDKMRKIICFDPKLSPFEIVSFSVPIG